MDGVTVDNDISDFTWDKVRWLNSHNVSCWPTASNITSVDVKQNGQICIDHSKKGQWPEAIPLESTVLEGNPYIIVKIDGTYYAATYEWLRPGQVCKLGFAGPLSITYASKDSLGRHTKRHPLQNWEPKGGEVIGFMVSGLARLQVTPNAVERSQIIWYKLPSVGGSIQGEQVGSYSEVASVGNGCKLDGFEESEVGNTAVCSEIPNRRDIVDLVAAEVGDIYKTDTETFTKRVVECLKDTDSNWGRSIRGNNTV